MHFVITELLTESIASDIPDSCIDIVSFPTGRRRKKNITGSNCAVEMYYILYLASMLPSIHVHPLIHMEKS